MTLRDILIKRRDSLVKKWFELILETYPEDSRDFFRKQKNQFANPLGYNLKEGISGLFEAIVEHGCDREKAAPYLDQILRIRAVQEFSPSVALSFVLDFKKIVRNELPGEPDEILAEDLERFDRDMDEMALHAFDIYMKCRERIFELRVNELRNLMFGALERANLVSFPGEEKQVKENKI